MKSIVFLWVIIWSFPYQSNTTGATYGAGNIPEHWIPFTDSIGIHVSRSLFCISVFVFFLRTKDEFEDTKGVNRNSISMNRQRTGQMKEYKEINNDLSTHTTKDGVTRTALKSRRELRCSRRVSSACSTSGTHRVNLVTN
jgi:hypothetical protein